MKESEGPPVDPGACAWGMGASTRSLLEQLVLVTGLPAKAPHSTDACNIRQASTLCAQSRARSSSCLQTCAHAGRAACAGADNGLTSASTRGRVVIGPTACTTCLLTGRGRERDLRCHVVGIGCGSGAKSVASVPNPPRTPPGLTSTQPYSWHQWTVPVILLFTRAQGLTRHEAHITSHALC